MLSMSFFKLLNKTPGTKKTHRTVIFLGNKPLYEQILKLLYIDLKKKAKPLFVRTPRDGNFHRGVLV